MSTVMAVVGLPAEQIKVVDQRDAVASTPLIKPRLCAGCDEPIPMNRLLAKPNALLCVDCQVRAGDVPPLRRFDEYVGEDMVSTVYVDDRKVQDEQSRHNRAIADRFYESAVGDDSFLERETGPGIGTLGLANAQYADDIS